MPTSANQSPAPPASPRRRILISNDDGLFSPGLIALVRALQDSGRYELRVVAPEKEQSGVGHGLTLYTPLFAQAVRLPDELDGIPAYMVAGTPADCVKIAITNLFPDFRPELVLSGINRGPNVGMNILYSGTVAAALEACINEIPALALSQDVPTSGIWHFAVAAGLALPLVEKVLAAGLPPWTALNVNFPDAPREAIRGLRLTRQGLSGFKEFYVEERAEGPRRRFRLEGEMIWRDRSEECDGVALKKGWVTVTPLSLSLLGAAGWEALRAWDLFGKPEK